MNVVVALRTGENKTNVRSESIARGLELAGCKITTINRTESLPKGTDLVLQTGFGKTRPLVEAIENHIPYLLAEAPAIRHDPRISTMDWSSFSYNGLLGGGYAPPAPYGEVWKPELKPMRSQNGSTIITLQVPNDHSLRGMDINAWAREQLVKYPDAELRPHPLMVPYEIESLDDMYARAGMVVASTSTQGCEALYLGIPVDITDRRSLAYDVKDREQWAHELSWRHAPHDALATERWGKHVLSGYEIAKVRAQKGIQEFPRDKQKKVSAYDADIMEIIRDGNKQRLSGRDGTTT